MTDMGRPPMGDEGRTEKAYTRITKQEERVLVEEFGSSGRGLRAALDALIARGPFVFRAEVGASVPAMSDQEMFAAHPMLDDDLPTVPDGTVGPPMLSDLEITAALALDKVVQSLPPVVDYPSDTAEQRLTADPISAQDIAHLLDVPVEVVEGAQVVIDPIEGATVTIAAQHRHKRGTPLSTTYIQGVMVRSFACAVDGCTVVLHS